jgi:Family of unknown function (DUF5681)
VKIKDENHEGYETGYGKPPESTRFKKGRSGNPRGRPKGAKGFAAALDRALKEPVIINEAGRRKTVTKLEAAFKQISNKAASGDPTVLRLLLSILQFVALQPEEVAASNDRLDETDEKVFKAMLNRLKLEEK